MWNAIFDELFDKKNIYKRLSAVEKINDSNEQLDDLKKCIEERIKYHYWCIEHHNKYNTQTHKRSILISIYMYQRMKDVQSLLNLFVDKYNEIKEKLKYEIQKEIKEERRRIKEERRRIDEYSRKRIEDIKKYYNNLINDDNINTETNKSSESKSESESKNTENITYDISSRASLARDEILNFTRKTSNQKQKKKK